MNRIKELRLAQGLSQNELANSLGIRQNRLSTWETGKYEPDNDMLTRIASFFGVSTDYLLGHTTETHSQVHTITPDMQNQIDVIMSYMERLNSEGLKRLAEYADDLVSSGKYEITAVEEAAM